MELPFKYGNPCGGLTEDEADGESHEDGGQKTNAAGPEIRDVVEHENAAAVKGKQDIGMSVVSIRLASVYPSFEL